MVWERNYVKAMSSSKGEGAEHPFTPCVEGSTDLVTSHRGTQHVWKTSGDGPCRFMTIIIPAEQVIDGAGEALLASKMAGLTE